MISLHVFSHKTPYKDISVNRHTNVNETFRSEGIEENVVPEVCQGGGSLHDGLRHIKHSLGSDTFRKDGGLRDVELQTSICLENNLKLRE
jgi:hypothetical protein